MLADILQALGGFTGLGALIAATATWRQMRPNHGSSMKDAITRVERGLKTLDHRIGAVEHRLTLLDERLTLLDERAEHTHEHIEHRLSHLEHNNPQQ
ncbi:flagellar motor protein [Schaalia sp. lx-260]|uniref:flagellar motor protein n=1 Tax=Schaalia sp. lx-260 TaxID=2899082 RepID=UPI001E416BD4|nr:flagellar motor protein [Schaalia sp. lx-260]MCD4549666.1 flagellar motor protein [Schaalia sp. lx-260]